MRAILAVVVVFALALSATALDFGTPEDLFGGIYTYDVLYAGDTAVTPDAGAFSIQGSFIYLMANKSYDEASETVEWGDDEKATYMVIPVKIAYGIIDGLEIGVTPVFMMKKYERAYVSDVTEYEGTGITDTWVWAKYGFAPEPMVTARLGLKLATGEDDPADDELPTGTGQMDIDGAIMLGAPMGPGWLDGSVGYRFRMARSADEGSLDEGDFKPGSEIRFYAGYTHFIGDTMNLRLGADGFFGSDDEIDEGGSAREFIADPDSRRGIITLIPGFDYMMDNGMSLGVDMYYPLTGTNVDAAWGLGVSVGWGS
jgi:hypothetical protein